MAKIWPLVDVRIPAVRHQTASMQKCKFALAQKRSQHDGFYFHVSFAVLEVDEEQPVISVLRDGGRHGELRMA